MQQVKCEDIADAGGHLRIALEDGFAEYMGDGYFILQQNDTEGEPQSVCVGRSDLLRMLNGPS